MTLTFPNGDLGAFRDFWKLRTRLQGVKTPRLEVFFILLERSWSVDVEKGRESNWESTQFPCVQVTCDMMLESSRRRLQLFFKPHCNQRSAQEVRRPQSRRSPSCCNFGTPFWESRDKKPFGCGPHGVTQSILYWGKVVASPEFGPWWILWVQSRLWLVFSTKGVPENELTNSWLVKCRSE
jgi:hypothetical protein